MHISSRAKALLVSNDIQTLERIWRPAQQARLREIVDLPQWIWDGDMSVDARKLEDIEILIATWGMPRLEEAQLNLMPRLRAIFYAAGTVKPFAGPFLERGITVVNASSANAVPVAEFALSQILFGLKQGWQHYAQQRANPGPAGWQELDITGAYGSTVGIVSLGRTGTKLCELLQAFTVRKLVYDPCGNKDDLLHKYGLHSVGLEKLFAESDVVTIHTPWLKETEGMITGALLSTMKRNSTFINTSRGALVCEEEMIEVLERRPDLVAVLDVTSQEPPDAGSPLYRLPNVVLMPHISGSKGNEMCRMADWMVDECIAWLAGRPLRFEVTKQDLERMA